MRPTVDEMVTVDFETETLPRYSLKTMSTQAYVDDERFKVLSVAIAEGQGAVQFYHLHGTGRQSLDAARERLAACSERDALLVCHNSAFDPLILARRWGIVFRRVFDTMGYLRSLDVAASLANGALLVGMRKADAPDFTEASLTNPVLLKQLAFYNAADVHIGRAIACRCLEDRHFPDREFTVMQQTIRENLRGIAMDRQKAVRLARAFAENRNLVMRQVTGEFPDFGTERLSNNNRVKEFVSQLAGTEVKSIAKDSPAVAELRYHHPTVDRFLGLRSEFGTWDKYAKYAQKIADGPARLFNTMRYWGAHTGRYSSGGPASESVNLQNLPKGRRDDVRQIGELRAVPRADEDESWMSGDLKNVEPRVNAFLAREEELLSRFADPSVDVYIWFAEQVFPGQVIEKDGENAHLRDLAKCAVIALGYGMSFDGFLDRLKLEDVLVDAALAERVFNRYQERFPKIRQLRWSLFNAFRDVVDCDQVSTVAGCTFTPTGFPDQPNRHWGVRVILPSHRCLYYRSIQKFPSQTRTGQWREEYWYAGNLAFDPRQAKGAKKRGKRVRKCRDGRLRFPVTVQSLVENIVQGTARDILVAQSIELDKHDGLWSRFNVHDELIVGTGRCRCANAGTQDQPLADRHEPGCGWIEGRKILKTTMGRVPPSLPELAGLPLGCALNDRVRDTYAK